MVFQFRQELENLARAIAELRNAGDVNDRILRSNVCICSRPVTQSILFLVEECIACIEPKEAARIQRTYQEALDALGKGDKGDVFYGNVLSRKDLVETALERARSDLRRLEQPTGDFTTE